MEAMWIDFERRLIIGMGKIVAAWKIFRNNFIYVEDIVRSQQEITDKLVEGYDKAFDDVIKRMEDTREEMKKLRHDMAVEAENAEGIILPTIEEDIADAYQEARDMINAAADQIRGDVDKKTKATKASGADLGLVRWGTKEAFKQQQKFDQALAEAKMQTALLKSINKNTKDLALEGV